MHAYASDDPVFLAMNARGQRETNGALGDFCVRCHAPVAAREGLTNDGLNLASLPPEKRGIGCLFCHEAKGVEGTHNATIVGAEDGVMRGGIRDPAEGGFHRSAYSSLHDRENLDSSSLCGGCHDIVTPRGIHLERTYAEWQASLFAKNLQGGDLSCSGCHMSGSTGVAAHVDGVPARRVHDHSMPGVDLALTPFPESDAQRAAVERELATVLSANLCVYTVNSRYTVVVFLENIGAGHSFPSGAGQDRRVWLELVAYKNGQVLLETGTVKDGESVASVTDPMLWQFRDWVYGEGGKPVHMFWDVASITTELLESQGAANVADPTFLSTHAYRTFEVDEEPDRVTMRMRMRPVGLDVLDDLVASGDLDPAIVAKMQTIDLKSSVIEWLPAPGRRCVPTDNPQKKHVHNVAPKPGP